MAYSKKELEDQRLLVERAKHDPDAFGLLFDTHYTQILRYIARRTGDVALAEDMTADVFLAALRELPGFKWMGVPISAWLYKIATNKLRMYYRRKKYSSSLEAIEEAEGIEFADETDLATEIIDAQEALERHQAFLHAKSHIARLPLRYQEVLVLRFVEEKKIIEISQILDKKENTVKSLLSRGLKMLRSSLERNPVQPSASSRIIKTEGTN